MAHPSRTTVIILGNIIFLFVALWTVGKLGSFLSKYLAPADPEIIQEHVSSFLSMSGFAPKYFLVVETFPQVGHKLIVETDTQTVKVKGGKFLWLERIRFKEHVPLKFSKWENMEVRGNCVNTYCNFSSYELNMLKIFKNGSLVEVNLSYGAGS